MLVKNCKIRTLGRKNIFQPLHQRAGLGCGVTAFFVVEFELQAGVFSPCQALLELDDIVNGVEKLIEDRRRFMRANREKDPGMQVGVVPGILLFEGKRDAVIPPQRGTANDVFAKGFGMREQRVCAEDTAERNARVGAVGRVGAVVLFDVGNQLFADEA